MRYILASQIYWPVWFVFKDQGYPYTGIFVGSLLTVFLFSALWRIEFGTWNFWE